MERGLNHCFGHFEFRLQCTAFFQTAPFCIAFFQTAPGRSRGVMTQSKRMRYNPGNGRSYDQALERSLFAYFQVFPNSQTRRAKKRRFLSNSHR